MHTYIYVHIYICKYPYTILHIEQVGAIGVLVQHCKSPANQRRAVLVWACTALCVLVMEDENRTHFTEANILKRGP